MAPKRALNHYCIPLLKGTLKTFRSTRRQALVVGLWQWRDYVADWIFEYNYVQIQRHFSRKYFNCILKPYITFTNPVIYIWGYKAPQFFIDYVRAHNLDIFFLEDGFIRSSPDMTSEDPPLSIVMDSQAPYFDTTRPNDLTDLIENFDFDQPNFDEGLAQELFDYYLNSRVSKYNHQPYVNVESIYGKKTTKRILVLGQVPHDDSLKYGGGEGISLLDVVNRAKLDNPTAQIIVKPHPMTLEDTPLLEQLKQLDCLILEQPIHLVDALETVDHVYTITSLGGLEAWLRGKEVSVLGRPFYYKLLNKIIKKNRLFYQSFYIYHR